MGEEKILQSRTTKLILSKGEKPGFEVKFLIFVFFVFSFCSHLILIGEKEVQHDPGTILEIK